MENTPENVKELCESLYRIIKEANEQLKVIRGICRHTETFEGLYSWRAGSVVPATICSSCGELIKTPFYENTGQVTETKRTS